MAYTTTGKVAPFMALADFDSNSIPTETEVTNMIVLADARVDTIEVSTTTTEKELLSTYLVAAMIAKSKLFNTEKGTQLADSYKADYNEYLQDIRNKAQFTLPNSKFAYGRIRKVNR